MRTRGFSAARRYARALLDVAESKGTTEVLDQGLTEFAALLAGNDELRRTLGNPAFGNDHKKAIARRILGSEPALLLGFVGILLDHEQFDLLPLVARSFHEVFNARRGVALAEAVSAAPLDQAQRQALEKALAATRGGSVELRTAVDPGVLGGVVVRMGGMTYDGTVRAHLRALKQALAGEG